ncbi:MAG: tetratricopeptide repeat protein [Caulobacteraceae bacterium]|nr:MAG: tetratricopeptide repeat protein [Caulobacteraceae bacterium]
MTLTDRHGLHLTGASRKAVDLWDEAVAAYNRYAGDPVGLLDAAIADSPGFLMAHVLKGYMHVLGSNPRAAKVAGRCLQAAAGIEGHGLEAMHRAALAALLEQPADIARASLLLEDVSLAQPHDIIALQIGQTLDFLRGDSRMLRDRIARALPLWKPDMPGYHAIQGMLAFGLEETGSYARAEAAGRLALELEPRNGWARHAVAHVMEMQDRREEGVAFMRTDPDDWSEGSFFAVHNWWHTALFHLGLGDTDGALAAYDGPIFGERSDLAFDMVDAAGLLWRMHLMKADVGDRWSELADLYLKQPHGQYAFDDAHAMMAFAATDRRNAAADLLAALEEAASGQGDHALIAREIGLPVARGIEAFGLGDYRRCSELLRPARNGAARFGGSHAQRDVIDLTLIEAAHRAGDRDLSIALAAERAIARG